ncbi:hypothetical protein IRZ71_21565 [Flavobacterium sp. ANB]|uniref:hypothetical protein n=1 Tax=unclassified Flavobacterium TaxID=196869 RepID=UPI0012B8EAB5|nr:MULTISPECIES: hypothetical protein [unclassified Flavobacterium]MBF4518953.1 hypothetical protein [Flavobacterium sp. ANB]MTD71563.1 hypothetical protein [Flavobacterium sp. LC2016-13]
MYKSVLISFTFFFICSCADNRDSWLQKYQNTKCAWAKVHIKFKNDSIQSITKLNDELNSIKEDIDKISKPVQYQTEVLKNKISNVRIKYLSESRKIYEEQEQVYGHISTPEFEKKQEQNNDNNNREVLILENKIAVLQSKLNNNTNYQELVLKQNSLKQRIAKTTNGVQEKYKVSFDHLQKELDDQNYNYKYILEKLNKTEKQNFENQRERIRANPCK